MTWTAPISFVNGDVPSASQMNVYCRDNLRDLQGTETAQTITMRECLFSSLGLFVNDVLGNLVDPFTSGGSSFRVVGLSADNSSAIATGNKVRLSGVMGAEDRTEQVPAWLEVERTGVGSGSLSMNILRAGVESNPPALRIKSNGHLQIFTDDDFAEVTVGGTARAVEYRVANVAIGKWTLAGDQMQYAGSMEVSGGYFAGGEGTGVAMEVDSTTLCTNVNVDKLRGQDWPAVRLQQASIAPVTVPTGLVYTEVVRTTADRDGYFEIDGEACFSSVSGHLSSGDPFQVTATGDPSLPANGSFASMRGGVGVAGEIIQIPITFRARYLKNDIIKLLCANNGDAPVQVSGSIAAVWLAPNVDILAGAKFSVPWTFSNGTSLA